MTTVLPRSSHSLSEFAQSAGLSTHPDSRAASEMYQEDLIRTTRQGFVSVILILATFSISLAMCLFTSLAWLF